jgi:hypothetical protein
MAKRRPTRRAKPVKSARKSKPKRRSGKRPIKKAAPRRKAATKALRKKKASPRKKPARAAVVTKAPRLDRARRTLDDTVPGPPSSLDMKRRGTAARTGRAEIEERRLEHIGMSPEIAGGDVDVDLEDAYFTGDEAPGADNPTPDQDAVDDIGKALGVEYADSEELKASDKVVERDKHRWELDPASSEDYRDRKK